MVRYRALLVAGAALLWFVIGTSLSAAEPIYTAWSAPVNLGPIVNSAAAEAGPALSGDGLSLYFYATNRPGGLGSDDIWVSQRPSLSAAWGAPVNLGPTINSASRDYVPAFSSDGHWMYFASDRPGGFGPPTGTPTSDLYRSYRADIDNDFGWQAPTNLGPNVNTAASENGNGYFDNGGHPQLFFGSDRLGPAGSADLYVSDLQADGSWGLATRIPELSSPSTENRPNLRQDGLEIFFYSDRAGSAGSDIWTATRASLDATWSTPVNLGPTVNSSVTDIHPYLSANGEALVFSSSRVGGSGSLDLWMTTRDATPTVTGSSVNAVEGAPFSGAVATVTDPDTAATAGEYTAAIDWGDGSPVGTGTVSGSGGSFTVSGSHTYAEEGSYTVTTTLTDVDTPANTATTTSTATVADAALTAGLISASCASVPCAVTFGFTDANPGATVADFTATINWGDSSSSAGVVSASGAGFVVTGSHVYADTGGGHPITVTVNDDGGSTVSSSAPMATAELIAKKRGGEDDGENSSSFTVVATCSSGTASALLNGVAVKNGDVVRLKLIKKGAQKVRREDGRLTISATSFQLVVTCTDAAGNKASATASPVFKTHGHDEDDEPGRHDDGGPSRD